MLIKYDANLKNRSRTLKLKVPKYTDDLGKDLNELEIGEYFVLHMTTLTADELLEFASLSTSSVMQLIPHLRKVIINNVFGWEQVKLSDLVELAENEVDGDIEFSKEALDDILSKHLHIFNIIGQAIEKENIKKKKK